MVEKIGVIFFLVIGLLVISSCDQSSQEGLGVSPKVLDFEFLEDYPQEDLSEDEEFQVGLKVFNELPVKAEFDLCIKGDRSAYYGGVPVAEDCISEYVDEAYEGSGGTIIPSEKIVYFPSEMATYSYHDLDDSVGDVSIRAEMTFSINSLSSVDVCILDNPNLQEDIDCDADEILGNSRIQQKAFPLVVSKIEKDIKRIAGSSKIDLKIYLDKASTGGIIREEDSQFDLIDVHVFLSGTPAEFVCKKREGRVVFMEGDPIECTADLEFDESPIIYKDNLNINLGYKYKSVKSKKIVFNIDWWEDQ
ncbi:hypothetical protein HOG16_01165 [Candidatus Woesearchaeota archaeon]|jgi:hypothetical protein|nr:hypothetical protein [Candidatus Woesearchaeota archaeon]MBT4321693.1 hypothetical protein [Candidatus Woesearchaeota archaeon]MBT4630723.1 hypothetical protein [Candidatus Woesearchaeota archaeon]